MLTNTPAALFPVVDAIARIKWDYWKWEDEVLKPIIEAHNESVKQTGVIRELRLPDDLAKQKQRWETVLGEALASFAADARYYKHLAIWEVRAEGGNPSDPQPDPEVVQRALSSDEAFVDELLRRGEALAQTVLGTIASCGCEVTSRTMGSTLWRFHVHCGEPSASMLCASLLARHRQAIDAGLLRVYRFSAGYTVPHTTNRIAAAQWLASRNLPL